MTAWVVELSGVPVVVEYDTSTYGVIATSGAIGSSVQSICLSPDSSVLYTGDTNTGVIASFDAATLAPITSVTLAIGAASRITVFATADNTALLVAERGANLVWVLDPTTLATVTTFTVTTQPTGMTQLPHGGNIYIAAENHNTVEVFTPSTYGHVTSIAVGTDPLVVLSNSSGTIVYALNVLAQTISVIDTSSNTVSSTVTLAGSTSVLVTAMALSADDKYLYIGSGAGTTDAWEIVTTGFAQTYFTTGANNQFVAILTDVSHVWYTVSSPSTVEAYNIPTNTLAHTITGSGGGPIVTIPNPFVPPPPTPPYPGGQFIPKLFIPIKGKQTTPYTPAELMANWVAIENWSKRWLPPPTVALVLPHKNDPTPEGCNANWITLEVWGQVIKNLGAPYTPLFVPRKASVAPGDLDINFLTTQNWANRLPL